MPLSCTAYSSTTSWSHGVVHRLLGGLPIGPGEVIDHVRIQILACRHADHHADRIPADTSVKPAGVDMACFASFVGDLAEILSVKRCLCHAVSG